MKLRLDYRSLVAACVALAVAGIAAVATRSDASPSSPPSPLALATPRSVGSPTTLAAGERRQAARATTTTTTGRARTLTIVPGALTAPHYGTYDVRTSTNGTKAAGTLYVGRDGTQRLTVVEQVRASKFRWGRHAELLRSGEAKGDGSCNWSPAAIVVATALTEGRRWTSNVTCTTTVGERAVSIRRQENAKVTRRVRTNIDGKPIDTWLIERRIVLTQRSDAATVVTEEASSELFAPSIGLAVYRLSRIDFPRADGTIESVIESIELVSAKPY